jgi:putative aldouronate transport system substrate-binding protein
MGFFNGYHAYISGMWTKDSAGKLVYGAIQPEVKTALQKLQELYKKGLIDKEFGSNNDVKVAEKATAGKVGILFSGMAAPIGFLQKGIDLDPKAQWQAYPIVSADGKPAKGQLGLGAAEYYVVKKGYKHPEAIIKMLNFWMEKKYGTVGYPNPYIYDAEDRNTTNYATVKAYPWTKNLDAHLKVTAALKTKDTSKLNAEEMSYHNNIDKYKKGDNKFWQWDRVFGEHGSWSVIDQYNKQNSFVRNEFYASPTETMVSKNSILNKKELEVFTEIIKGAPIESFDKFIAEWNKLGGEQLTKEINDWYKTK